MIQKSLESMRMTDLDNATAADAPDLEAGGKKKKKKKGKSSKSDVGCKLKKVDLMLYTTTSPENPMIITTLLMLKGTIEFKKLKDFIYKMCYTHERMRMKVINSTWQKADLDLDAMVSALDSSTHDDDV